MQVIHVHNPRLGAIPEAMMFLERQRAWQGDLLKSLHNICQEASRDKENVLLITGSLFADAYVSNSIVTEALTEIGNCGCSVVLTTDDISLHYLHVRDDLPGNLRILTPTAQKEWETKHAPLSVITGDAANLVSMEPASFDEGVSGGYQIMRLDNGSVDDRKHVSNQILHRFITCSVSVDETMDQKAIAVKCNAAIGKCTRMDLVRLILTGSMKADAFFNPERMIDLLGNKVYHLEVYNNCSLALDMEEYATDISLRSEFIRMVAQDDSLSDSEKSRVIQCGWNALAGKELPE